MRNKTIKNSFKIKKFFNTRGDFSLLIFFLFISIYGTSQSIPETFRIAADSLINASPQSYTELHSVLRKNRNDTILMRFFSEESAKNNYASGESYALNALGRKFRNITQYSKAIKYHQLALDVAIAADNLEFRVASLNNLGVVYRRTSAIRTAMDYNQKALELAETVEDPPLSLKRSINISHNCIGNLYQELGQFDRAIAQFKMSLALETELNNKLGQAINHQNIGECKEELGNLEGALKDYKTSLAFNESINNDMGRVICNTSIAQIFNKQNKPQEALALLNPTLVLAKTLGDGFLISPAYINHGWANYLLQEYTIAEKNILQGLKLAEKYNLKRISAQACHLLSKLNQEQRNFEKALTYNLKAEKLEEDISNESTLRYVNDIMFRYDSQKKSTEIEMLAKENENVRLALQKNRTILLITCLALALLGSIFYILYRQYQLNNEKKLLTLEQSMLRSQMNPHFLFNSLNSIKLYIINNEQKNAVYYLNKFSKLVRKILEASSLKEIPLAEELETIELYMNIENIRFSNEIDFKIIISDDIDPQNVKIPSLILQPFLENALWHGLSSVEGKKQIVLDISQVQDKDFIRISIADNGIGRAASEKIKANKVLKKNSVGIAITKERLSNFSRDYQNTFNLEIIDLHKKDGTSNGTEVVLLIPTV